MIDLNEIKVDKRQNVPACKHVEQFLRSKIESQELKPGDKLPPKRDFLRKAGIGSKTISEAIEALCKEGLIETSKRGTFVTNNIPQDRLHPLKVDATKSKVMLLTPDITAYVDSMISSGIFSALSGTNVEFLSRNIDSTVNKTDFDTALMDVLCEKCTGIIVMPPFTYQLPLARIKAIQELGIGVVFCHRRPVGASGPLIAWDWGEVGHMAARLFLDNNHTKVGYIASIKYEVSVAYEKALKQTLKQHLIDIQDNHICYGGSSHRSVETECEKIDFLTAMLSDRNRPTALFCNDASSEILTLMMARKMGIKIPEDLSILRFGTAPHDYHMGNAMSSLFVDHKKIGHLAMQTLIEMQTGSRTVDDDEVIHVPIEFNKGETLGPAPDLVP